MMAGLVFLVLVVCLAATLIWLLSAPSFWDKLLGANVIGTLVVLLLVVAGHVKGRPDFVDLALVYGFLNWVGMFAVLRYFRVNPSKGDNE